MHTKIVPSMILHIVSDDKFTDYAINQFMAIAGEQNIFVVLCPTEGYVCKHIVATDKVRAIAPCSAGYYTLIAELQLFKAIIVHNLDSKEKELFVTSAPAGVKLAWVFWGGEVYNRRENLNNCFGPITRRRFFKKDLILEFKTRVLKAIQKEKYLDKYQVSFGAFRKLGYCLTDMEEDYLFAKKALKSQFGWLWYNYYNIDETLGPIKEQFINGPNILIGNSATETNNHLEAFELLRKFTLGNRKLITPLSYGTDKYKNEIIEIGRGLFGDNFYPLTEFMEREKYNGLLLTCEIVIMNHYRHQAMGNIITALWLGSRVYVSNRSTTYQYLKRLGLHIFSVEADLSPINKQVFSALPKSAVEENRKILIAEYGKEEMLLKVKRLFETLNA